MYIFVYNAMSKSLNIEYLVSDKWLYSDYSDVSEVYDKELAKCTNTFDGHICLKCYI